MLRVALCDDNPRELELLAEYLRRTSEMGDYEIVCDRFTDGFSLLERMDKGVYYDLCFLDVVMPVINGMQVGKEIADKNLGTKIVYLTASPEYALESYSVGAVDYLIKPLTEIKYNRAMERFFATAKAPDRQEIILQEKGQILRLSLHTLIYVEAYDHNLEYHFIGRETVVCRQTLGEVSQLLSRYPKFIKPHRSYIINLDHVTVIDSKRIIMVDGSSLPIARGNGKPVADTYLQYKLNQGGKG